MPSNTSVYDWLCLWYELRSKIIKLFKFNIQTLEKVLKKQSIDNKVLELIDNLRDDIIASLKKEKLFPRENRPFEKPQKLTDNISKVKNGYFASIRNYAHQMTAIFKKEDNDTIRLAVFNLRNANTKLFEMQSFFKQISEETKNNYEDYSRLCKEETFWIDRLIALNDYYLQVGSNNFYNCNLVASWKMQKEKQLIAAITEKINQANEFGYKYVFPFSIIEEGNLLKFPLIVKNLHIEDAQEAIALLVNLVSMVEYKVDYIYLLICNEANIVMRNGLSISKSYLEKFKTCIETGDESIIENTIPPLPIEISEEFLCCFVNKFYLEREPYNNFYLDDINTLYLHLWEYSQYAKNLSSQDVDEKKYLSRLQKNKRGKIDVLFEEVKNIAPAYFIEKINALKIEVINENYYFDDMELNICINEIISYTRTKNS